MVASPRTGSPLFQQQESPLDPSPQPSPKASVPVAPAAASESASAIPSTATSAASKPGLSSPGVLHGDHSQERDIAVHIEEPPKDLADAPAQGVAADTRVLPADAAPRRPCWRDPFGWVLRPRAVNLLPAGYAHCCTSRSSCSSPIFAIWQLKVPIHGLACNELCHWVLAPHAADTYWLLSQHQEMPEVPFQS